MPKQILVMLLALAAWSCAVLAEEPPPLACTVESFKAEGDNPLDATTTTAALAPFLGSYTGVEGLLAATNALTQALSAGGFAFYRASLPPQDLASGVVTLKVVTFGLAAVTVRGQKYFSEDSVRRSLPLLAAGTTPNTHELSHALTVANQHPSKRVKVKFRESQEKADALDAIVNVTDQRPWSLTLGANNIGSEGGGDSSGPGNIDTGNNSGTGRSRMTLGGQYTNLTGHDDILAAAFTTSPENADDVRQYSGSYQIPIYRVAGWLSAFYVRSDVDVANVQNVFDIFGAGEFYGINFRRPLFRIGRYHHTITVGLQDRLFDTQIAESLTGLTNVGLSTKVRSRPLSFRYDGGYNWTSTSLDFYFDINHNLSFGGHNNASDYAKVRDPADPEWKALRYGLLVTQRLPRGVSGVARATGQFTGEPMLPGEELGIGGVHSVRGFEERTIAGDTGIILNFEVWSPPLAQLYGVRLLGFFDVGHKVLEEPVAGQRPNDTISSVGIGARWQWHKQVAFSVDYGQPLANAAGEASDRGNSK